LRNYHTTKTAQGTVRVVDRDDDLIATIRYICAMVRWAVKESEVISYDDEEEFEEELIANGTTGY